MYEVLIGFNVRLEEGEAWPPKGQKGQAAGGDGNEPREARFEPGEKIGNLPAAALKAVEGLVHAGVLKEVRNG